ncbi:MAG TPA: EAL domain-containing protein [Nocardioidaceae bacterium]|nr:EAL domain-containing protein [Nocardioidaceae bacterium]
MTPILEPELVRDRDSELSILLIEDSCSDSDLVVAMLEDELPKAEVHVAANLQDAMALLHEIRFDLALADLALPDADGLAVVRAVRTSQPDAALLVLTGRPDGDLALWALAEGAQDYLVKGQNDGARLATALLHALQRQRTEKEAHTYLQLARGLLDALDAPTCAVAADGRIVAVNRAWRDFMDNNGGRADECGEGNDYLAACDGVCENAEEALTAAQVAAGLRDVLAGRLDRFHLSYPCHSPDEERWFSVRLTPAEVDGGGGAVISHVDITEMHTVQRSLSHQAMHDSLTGLPNRLLLTDRLDQALLDVARRGREVAVAFVDLDRFKRINDSFGHVAGDALLTQVAGRLSGRMRASDTLARISGDEFVVVWRDLASADEAILLADRLAESLEPPFELGPATVSVSASIGAVIGRPDETAEDMLKAADAAMYEAKRRGGGRVRVFTNDTRSGVEALTATEVDLRAALIRDELVVHYQPVIDLASGRAVAVEALVRWQHPERGLLGPDQFIPIAEESGLIVPLGRWVLERACSDAVGFTGLAQGLDVAVNLSVRQLTQSDVLSHVRQALVQSGLDPQRLLLEVTESAVMEDAESAAIALDALSHLGVRIAIDDFGTGYSSLLYLRLYPISALKLDRAFVSGIGVSPDDEAICGSVVSLAHAVGATSIAEGVETMEQYAVLRALGCQQAQGFLWSPAVPLADLSAVLLTSGEVARPAAIRPSSATREKRNAAVVTRATATAADKTAEAAETARGATAVAVADAAKATALTAAETAAAVQLQADASAAKVAEAASRAASAIAVSLGSGGDAASELTASQVAATVTAAAAANAEETALAAAIVARAVAAAAAQAAHTASAAAMALEAEVVNAAAAVRAVAADAARTKQPGHRRDRRTPARLAHLPHQAVAPSTDAPVDAGSGAGPDAGFGKG